MALGSILNDSADPANCDLVPSHILEQPDDSGHLVLGPLPMDVAPSAVEASLPVLNSEFSTRI